MSYLYFHSQLSIYLNEVKKSYLLQVWWVWSEFQYHLNGDVILGKEFIRLVQTPYPLTDADRDSSSGAQKVSVDDL